MDETISSAVAAQIMAAVAASPAAEVCGLLFGPPGRIEHAAACRNVAAEPARRFEIDPAALIAAHRAARTGGPRLAGHYHSHPGGSAVPSACDAAAAVEDGALWLIAAGGVLQGWRFAGERFTAVTLTIS